ncbi:ABC transporter permease DevC [Trichormus variabilis]|uniref:ABC transporter n=1 Tax=Trichormus variabilis SAG 1403-4b TaxID=447716 RepID=A0A3S1I689_ANAVA|nr:ABC transporter permease DevC [Trichormus variabilis]MBD2627012.1 FtsX-like permease family protein [Trichormus variabilis FACHB-164]RUS92763.1 ABC transporter [Trichormus variabilis SAG 1403-4b]
MWKRKIPLAWLQLSREKARMGVAIAGIAFADVLMFLQLGIREALFDGAVQLHNSLEGEIVLVSSRYKALISLDQFSQRRLYQALGFTGVQSVSPIYLDSIPWKNPDNQQTWRIFAIGFNPEEKVVNLTGVQDNLNYLKEPDTVLFDRGSRKEFGNIVSHFENNNGVTTELNNRQINVVGLFRLGTSFGVNGNIITSDVNFLRLFANKRRKKGLIDFGLIKLEPDADVNWVIANLKANLPNDVQVLSKQEFVAKEKSFWNTSTPVGFTFTLGAIIGFVVGAVIVYQILYSDVSDHLPEYATLKAIGFKNNYLLVIVFQEALILAAIGFIPGFAISQGLYFMTRQATLLPIIMTVDRAIFIFILTTLMCSISALIAMQKLQAADPADVF